MFKHLSYETFLELAQQHKPIAVYQEMAADRFTPIGIMESLQEAIKNGVVLESGLGYRDSARYSFIFLDPIAEFRVEQGAVSVKRNGVVTPYKEASLEVLRQLKSELACTHAIPETSAMHGAVGLVTYDAVRLFESIPDRHVDQTTLPEMLFHFYRTCLKFDHVQQKLLISSAVEIGEHPQQNYLAAQNMIQGLVAKISASTRTHLPAHALETESPVQTDLSDTEFMQLVERAKSYIVKGDAFQIVLSRRFSKAYQGKPLDVYRALRSISPSPYMFYLPVGDSVIVGASPEKLVSVQEGVVEVNPIAGTRRREQRKDEAIAQELLNDPKEVAEHMMLVDLARNDVGAVCQVGSVTVPDLLKVKHFSHVSHMTSIVRGQLRQGKDALDALVSVFPAGTLSGAPKIRAMQIIDELETSKRGMYGGAICRLDDAGNLDSCIAIRMAVLKEGIATVRTGAGIVYDSNPQAEASETRQKAAGVLTAIGAAVHYSIKETHHAHHD